MTEQKGFSWVEANLLEATHSVAKVVCDFRSLPEAARTIGSPPWEHLMWAIGDFERRYRDLVGDPPGEINRYHGVKLEDGTVLLQGERGVILAELVARAINLDDTEFLVIEIPGAVPDAARENISKQVRALLGDFHRERPVIVLANGMRWHALKQSHIDEALKMAEAPAKREPGAETKIKAQ